MVGAASLVVRQGFCGWKAVTSRISQRRDATREAGPSGCRWLAFGPPGGQRRGVGEVGRRSALRPPVRLVLVHWRCPLFGAAVRSCPVRRAGHSLGRRAYALFPRPPLALVAVSRRLDMLGTLGLRSCGAKPVFPARRSRPTAAPERGRGRARQRTALTPPSRSRPPAPPRFGYRVQTHPANRYQAPPSVRPCVHPRSGTACTRGPFTQARHVSTYRPVQARPGWGCGGGRFADRFAGYQTRPVRQEGRRSRTSAKRRSASEMVEER
jgi:hypothetical protein